MAETTDRASAWPEFARLFLRLREEVATGRVVVLVEGERDRRSLKALGLRGPVELVHAGRTMSELAARLSREGRRVVVLTDWDAAGGQLARKLREFLEAEAVGIDLEYRRRFARVLRGEVVHVEGLNGWAKRTAAEAGTPIDDGFGDETA
jgi:5S rRNA maturation endonuclease (ribonuclease M5)